MRVSWRLIFLVSYWFCGYQKIFCLLINRQNELIPHFIGFDLGTSGGRISVIARKHDKSRSDISNFYFEEVYTQSVAWRQRDDSSNKGCFDDPDAWMHAVDQLLAGANVDLGSKILGNVKSMCISGTSASCCLIDSTNLTITRQPRMYNYHVITSTSSPSNEHHPGQRALDLLDRCAPPRHTARSATGSLAKLLAWHYEHPLALNEVLCHQSDYVRIQLSSKPANSGPMTANALSAVSPNYCFSDWHNCLKLGYDVRQLAWPSWLLDCLTEAGISDPMSRGVLPLHVVSPGQPLARVHADVATKYGLSPDTYLVAGTTDSNAAFMAAALGKKGFGNSSELVGTAVTSLGSTLALKLLSKAYVEDAERGVYSHRFPQLDERAGTRSDGELWLVGGASNVGCAVLRQQCFDNDELDRLSAEIDPSTNSPLSYYPLATQRGERFPVADGNKLPCLEPIPDQRRDYLHGILQGIGDVERDGYRILGELGAVPSRPSVIWTCGGGSRNGMWMSMRERRLNQAFGDETAAPVVHVKRAENVEASYGAALLASLSFCQPDLN
jgi:xylulokinase